MLSNIDDLFELPAPAGMKRGMNKGRWPYTHGCWAEGLVENLLLQQLNFKLFGFPYLVGIIKFNLFSPWLLEK